MNKLFFIAGLFLSYTSYAQNSKTLLAIFPHPDDETAIAEVLIKYKGLGYNVQLIIATDGKDGTRVTKIPAGDSLGNLRKDETRCACKIMDIAEPMFLGIERLETKLGVGKYFKGPKRLLEPLKITNTKNKNDKNLNLYQSKYPWTPFLGLFETSILSA